MIYLFSQMLVALALAAILGGAIGWLIHRTTQTRQISKLQRALGRQHQQLTQSQSDIAMLTDDYSELQNRSRDEIDVLQQQNQQIPALSSNLEKSQLLVQQMIRRHESRVRDLSNENQTLTDKLKTVTDREQTHNTVQPELDNSSQEPQKDSLVEVPQPTAVVVEEPQRTAIEEVQQPTAIPSSSAADTIASSDTIAEANSATVNIMADDTSSTDATAQISNARSVGSWASAPVSLVSVDNTEKSNNTVISIATDRVSEDANTLHALDGDSSLSNTENDPFDEVMEVGDELQRELDIDPEDDPILDGSIDTSNLFEPVEHQDDLKQIFGIGPITEKALNELGITSYSQLADLKHHDIETIANALQIVPGRIERDDWMGNARRQLEDVLEDL